MTEIARGDDIEREPQIHLGPSVAALAARAIDTDRADVAQEIKAVNAAPPCGLRRDGEPRQLRRDAFPRRPLM